LLHGAADLADERNSFRRRILVERYERIARGRADDRIAANADERRYTKSRLHEIETEQRAERARSRDHADIALLEDAWIERRHEPDEIHAGRYKARGIGTNDERT